MWWLSIADGPFPIGDIIYGIGVTVEIAGLIYVANKYSAQTSDVSVSQSKTKNTQENRLVIQIQNCRKGNSKETLGTSKTQYGDPRVGVTKAQALGALELATKDLMLFNKSMVKSAEFQNAKEELQEKILASKPLFGVSDRNILQTTFEYKGTKYRIDLDSYVPTGNTPNLME